MMRILKVVFGPLKRRLRLALWELQGWFPWAGARVYAPRGAHLMREVARTGDYEHFTIQVIRNFCRPGTVFVDVGANLGLVSLAVLATNREVEVHAYEPSPNSRGLLRKTHAESGFSDRWHIHETACADRQGNADFYLSSPALGAFDGLSISSRAPQAGKTPVKLVRLDDEWRSWANQSVSVVKIDVEGAEGGVCAGMDALISTCRPVILLEWNLVNLEASGADPAELFRIAVKYDFRVYDPDTLQPVPSLHWVRLLLARGRDTFLMLPKELTSQDGVP